jgi:peptidyl-dipeptidase A
MRRLSLVAIGMLALTPSPVIADTHAPLPADAFVAQATEQFQAIMPDANRAMWLAQTHATPDTERLNARLSAELGTTILRLARDARHYRGQPLPPLLSRQIGLIGTRIENPVPADPVAAADAARLRARLLAFNAGRSVDVGGVRFASYGALRDAMENTDDPAQLSRLWSAWAGTGAALRPDYTAFVGSANEGARSLGYRDLGELWRSANDLSAEETRAETRKVWDQITPLYELLHCYVRKRLNEVHGDGVQPRSGPIRIDLTRNPVGMFWRGLTDTVSPWQPSDETVDKAVDGELRRRNLSGEAMARLAEDFYVSIGYPRLPDSFWQRSLFERPTDRVVDCSGSATQIDGTDVRLKFCATSDLTALRTMVHEVGHVYYALAYADQPLLFRAGASGAFHEGLADFATLSMTPAYYRDAGLLADIPDQTREEEMRALLERALERLPLLAYATAFEEWRWSVFAGTTLPERYNSDYWRIVGEVQGLAPPEVRPADGFDAAAVPHLANNMPYNRYLFANVLQYQLFAQACADAGWKGLLHRCSIYGNRAVGARLWAMSQLGASRPWRETLQVFGIHQGHDATAFLAYFEPLRPWLIEATKKETCGW